jgi:purine-binding chemotaxis protein CheW
MSDTKVANNQLVVFSLGDGEYALPIDQVQEIIRYIEPRAVDSDIASIRGVISLRGKIVPVCDLAAHLGSHSSEQPAGKIVIVETGGTTAAIIVDDVAEVLTYSPDDVDPVPVAGADSFKGISQVGDRLIVLLDIDGVFGEIDLDLASAA